MSISIVLEPGSRNVLDLDFPHAYWCKVYGYYHDQSVLMIQVAPDKQTPFDTFYVIFENVHYFDGPLLWQGANLRVALADEQFDFTMDKSLVATSQELCIFDNGNHQIRVLAGAWIVLVDEIPARFR